MSGSRAIGLPLGGIGTPSLADEGGATACATGTAGVSSDDAERINLTSVHGVVTSNGSRLTSNRRWLTSNGRVLTSDERRSTSNGRRVTSDCCHLTAAGDDLAAHRRRQCLARCRRNVGWVPINGESASSIGASE